MVKYGQSPEATPTSDDGGVGNRRRCAQARVTLPALMHEVHTFRRLGVEPTTARTRWMLGFQRRLVRRCEWEMLCPKPGPLPQTSQVAATVHSLLFVMSFVGSSRAVASQQFGRAPIDSRIRVADPGPHSIHDPRGVGPGR